MVGSVLWHDDALMIIISAWPRTHNLRFGKKYKFLTLDGSVLLTHGGIEMGQGLHTKMIQVASRTLDINPELIHINEVSTLKALLYDRYFDLLTVIP